MQAWTSRGQDYLQGWRTSRIEAEKRKCIFFYMLLNLLFNLCVTWKYEGENPNYKLKPRSGSVFTNSETNQEDERL